jgi:hypothetical protein
VLEERRFFDFRNGDCRDGVSQSGKLCVKLRVIFTKLTESCQGFGGGKAGVRPIIITNATHFERLKRALEFLFKYE